MAVAAARSLRQALVMSRNHASEAAGVPWVAALLLLSLLLAGVLAWHAQYAVGSHRAAAEEVLRDYGALAAEEANRRVTVEVGFYGYRSAVGLLSRAVDTAEGELPPPAEVGTTADDRGKRSLGLVRYFFSWDPVARELGLAGEEPNADERSWLVASLEAGLPTPPDQLEFGTHHGTVEDAPVTLVYQTPTDTRVIGFGARLDATAPWIERALSRGPLLPKALGEVPNEALFVRLVDAAGNELYRAGPQYQSALVVARGLPEDYVEVFDGLMTHVAVDPEAARTLVIGGLPRSRLPVLLGVLGLTAGLLLTAILQLRRERALTRLRSDFVSRVSHELRTPLTQIRLFAETLLMKRVRSEDERHRAVEIIDREARRLSALVENVLQFSRAEREQLRFAPRRQDLAPLVQSMAEEFEPLAMGGGVEISVDVAAEISVMADENALHQVLLNLLDNAVKYGPQKQEIILGAESDNGVVRIWVDDEGPGIPESERANVWKAFRRGKGLEKEAISGTGIGLSVVSDLVTGQQGRCWVADGSRGGARVVIELPTGLDTSED